MADTVGAPRRGTITTDTMTEAVATAATAATVQPNRHLERPPSSALALVSAVLLGSGGGTSGITSSMSLNSFIGSPLPATCAAWSWPG